MTLPSRGAITAGSVVEAFHTPRSFPAFSNEGNTSIDKAQPTLEYTPYPSPNSTPRGQSKVIRLFGKMTKVRAATLIHNVARLTTEDRRLIRSDRIPETSPLTTAPPSVRIATRPVTCIKFAMCCTVAKKYSIYAMKSDSPSTRDALVRKTILKL